MNPSKETYLSLEEAYFDFNNWLFDGKLPPCLVTLQRKNRTNGYFCAERFEGKNGNTGQVTDEIALNPDAFGRDDIAVLATLAHEMTHLWQHHFGEKKSRTAYHNAEWAAKMEAIGLMPSNTGNEGGKKTGQHMTNYTIPGGAFETVAKRLLATGGHIHWKSYKPEKAAKPTKNGKRTKYTCPSCGAAVWGKEGLAILCQDCEETMGSARDRRGR
jgi:hypothetical protein